MLRPLIAVGYLLVYTLTFAPALSKSSNSNKHLKQRQHHGNSTEVKDISEMELLSTELPSFSNKTSLKMLEDITAKVWRILPVIDIPRNWVLTYCMRNTEIHDQMQRATMQCQYDGTDWDCVFIELGGGRDDFNMGKVVSSFHELSDRGLRSKLLRAAEICGKLWQRYKRIQDKRLIRMRLNVHVKNRRKRFSKKNENSRYAKRIGKNSKNIKDDRNEEVKKARRAAKQMKAIRRKLANKITELENKKSLSSEESTELDRLHLTMATKPRVNSEYPLTEERAELSSLEEIGSCLSRQAGKACESVVLKAVQKLI